MVTKKFNDLFERVESRLQDVIAISGPKGVGKSLALAAIATKYAAATEEYAKRACLLVSPALSKTQAHFDAALEEVYIQHGVNFVLH